MTEQSTPTGKTEAPAKPADPKWKEELKGGGGEIRVEDPKSSTAAPRTPAGGPKSGKPVKTIDPMRILPAKESELLPRSQALVQKLFHHRVGVSLGPDGQGNYVLRLPGDQDAKAALEKIGPGLGDADFKTKRSLIKTGDRWILPADFSLKLATSLGVKDLKDAKISVADRKDELQKGLAAQLKLPNLKVLAFSNDPSDKRIVLEGIPRGILPSQILNKGLAAATDTLSPNGEVSYIYGADGKLKSEDGESVGIDNAGKKDGVVYIEQTERVIQIPAADFHGVAFIDTSVKEADLLETPKSEPATEGDAPKYVQTGIDEKGAPIMVRVAPKSGVKATGIKR